MQLFYSFALSCISIMVLSQTAPKFHDTKGNIEVTPAGQLQYTLSVDVPPGIKKVSPNISLVYVSGAGNGLAGYGWNISGLTAISRVGKNLEKDGVVKNVQLDYSDYYSFNGQRLILKSGEYGKDGAEYVTEKYSNIKIKSVGAVSGQPWQGPEYWEVISPDGSQAWYGASAPGNSPARTPIDYNLVKSKDAQGNYITYNYTFDKNVSVINSIEWGGNEVQNTPHMNKIAFIFGARPMPETAYIKGVEFSQSKLLESIVVSTAGKQYKKYNVSYSKDVQKTAYQYPDKITTLNSQDEESNSVLFTYEKTIDYWSNNNMIASESYSLRPNPDHDIVGDFDGDGNLDILRYHTITSSLIPQTGLYLYTDFYTGGYSTNNPPIFLGNSLTGVKDAIPINLKKDNRISSRQGFVTRKTEINPSTSKLDLVLSFYSITENNQLSLDIQKTIANTDWDRTSGTTQNGTRTSVAGLKNVDFNGDGLSEIVVMFNDKRCRPISDDLSRLPFDCTDSRRYSIVDPDESIQNNGWFYPLSLYVDSDKRDKDVFMIYRGGDFNGDGLFDLLKLDDNKKPQLITFQKNAQGKYNADISPFNPANNEILQGVWEESLVGDYNGDGVSDLMMPGTGSSWYLYTSKGNGFKEESHDFMSLRKDRIIDRDLNNQIYIYNPRTFVAYDINNDGKTELIGLSSSRFYRKAPVQDSNQGAKYQRTYSVHANVFSIPGGDPHYVTGTYGNSDEIIYLNDNNIDAELSPNSRDMMGVSVDQWTGAMLRKLVMASAIGDYSGFNSEQKLAQLRYYDISSNARIKSISQGSLITDITFKQLDKKKNPGLYDAAKIENYPYVEISQSTGIFVVSGLSQTTTSDKKLKQDFRYRGLTSNILGRGLVGFRKTARSSWYADGFENTKIWTGVETDPANDGIPVKEWSIRTNDETKIFPADISENNTQLLSFKSITYKIDKLLNGQVVTSVPDADKAKVVTAIVPTISKSKDFLTGVITQNTITYGNYYLPSVSTTSVNGNLGVYTKKFGYIHNPSGQGKDYFIGRIAANIDEKKAYSDTRLMAQYYQYENNLLKTSTVIAGQDIENTIEDEFTYDGFGNITGKLTRTGYDPKTLTEKSEYDPTGRFVVKKTDNLGLETSFTYNDWGQVLTQTDPWGNTLNTFYDHWGKLGITTSTLEGLTSYTYQKDDHSNTIITQFDPDGNITNTFTNKLGQVYKVSTKAFGQGQYVSQETHYDVLGRKIKESEPYFEGQAASQWNTIAYDDTVFPAKVTVTAFNGKQTETIISGLTTTVKELNGYGRTTSKTADALGNMISSTDKGGTVQFSYNAEGKQTQAKYAENVVTTKYDVWGRKSEFNDPSNGLYKYEYNLFGQPTKIISPKGIKEYTYNKQLQLVSQRELSTSDGGQSTDKHISFIYDIKGLLIEKSGISKGEPYSSKITHDPQGRLLSSTEKSNGRTYTQKNIIYDDKGRITSYEKELQSSGVFTKVTVENIYDPWSGELYQVKDKASGKVLWRLNETNAKGQVLKAKLGAAEVNNTYDANGFLTNVNHSSVVNPSILQLAYSFDAIKNELTTRTTGGDFNITETFDYDDNNRLINWTDPVTGIKPSASRNVYDIKGRITQNDQVGTMKYENSARIYQPTGMTLNADGIQNYNGDLVQSITYNENNDPVFLDGEKGDVAFQYGLTSMRQRVSYGGNFSTDEDGRFVKFYSEDGSFEIIKDNNNKTDTEKHLIYIGGMPYESNIVYLKNFNNDKGSYIFLHKDYIGSILAISDEEGNKLEQRHFDAWGSLTHLQVAGRHVATSKDDISDILGKYKGMLVDRGYTSHEHFMEVGIIHMNGRLYDPLLRRFLNADENIQEPTNTQNYNKYGYVMNNPLMYSDPDGEFWLWFAGAIVGGYLNGVAANNGNWNPTKWDWEKSWSAVLGGAIGGAAVSGTLGNIASNAGAIKSFVPGIVSGGLNSAFNGGNFLGGAIGGISSYTSNIFENKVTSTNLAKADYRYIISPDYNDLIDPFLEDIPNIDGIENQYPRFYKVLSKLQAYATNNTNIMDALVSYSGYSRSEMIELLKIENLIKLPLEVKQMQSVMMNGNGKEIKKPWHGFGKTNHKYPFTMSINKSWVSGLERASLNSTINGTSFVLAVTVFHELVHYGRFIHRLEQNYEYGHGFELKAFGGIIGGNNAINKAKQYGWKF